MEKPDYALVVLDGQQQWNPSEEEKRRRRRRALMELIVNDLKRRLHQREEGR